MRSGCCAAYVCHNPSCTISNGRYFISSCCEFSLFTLSVSIPECNIISQKTHGIKYYFLRQLQLISRIFHLLIRENNPSFETLIFKGSCPGSFIWFQLNKLPSLVLFFSLRVGNLPFRVHYFWIRVNNLSNELVFCAAS